MDIVAVSKPIKTHSPMAVVMSSPNFRLLWAGQGMSLLGDQFYLIAMPWLILQRTGDPLALGIILALAGLPRAVFMLLGGAVTDRFSPRKVMLVSDLARLGLIAGLTALALTNTIQTWMLYAFSFLFGIAAGFFMPASTAMVPRLVGANNLRAGNAITQSTSMIAQFLGPVMAGGLIAWAGRDMHFSTSLAIASPGLEGAALAFGVDALTFLISVLTLWMITLPAQPSPATHERVLESIWSGLRQFWQDTFIRFVLIMMGCGGLIFTGALMVGVPVLANTHMSGGATTYGILMSAYAAGCLMGVMVAGSLPKQNPFRIKVLLTAMNLMFALGWFSFVTVHNTAIAAAVMLLIGVGSGYQMITFFTALQQRVPKQMLGRLMSLVLLFNVGLSPLSQAIAGLVIKWSLAGLFGLTGVLFLIMVIWASFKPEYRMVGEILAAAQPMD